MKNLTLLSVLVVSLSAAASSFAQTSTTNESPAFGYPSYAAPGANSSARLPTAGTERTFAPDFGGYPEPNTSPTSGEIYSPSSEKHVPEAGERR
jgi:hypothetical protein